MSSGPGVTLNPEIFRAYDIRGVVDRDLTPAVARRIGGGFGAYIRKRGGRRVAVGYDTRSSGPPLVATLVQGLRAAGLDVVTLGLAPTPVTGFVVDRWGLDGGISVTASHNPINFNGFKLLQEHGEPLLPEEIEAVRVLTATVPAPSGREGALDERDPFPEYRELLRERFTAARPLRVVADCGNGVTALTGPPALQAMGVDLIPMRDELLLDYPHHLPDPQEAGTMVELAQRVRAERADLGLAWDGDGDRLGVVDEDGVRYEADWITAVLARPLLAASPGARVLLDYKVSRSVVEDLRAHGAEPILTRTGYSLVRRRMRAEGIAFGGEASGHIIFGDGYPPGAAYPYLDDGVYGACALVDMVSRDTKPLSAYFQSIRPLITSPELRLPCADSAKFGVAEAVADHFAPGYPVGREDGARIDFGDAWALVRASNTNPYLSVRFEADSEQAFDRARRALHAAIAAHPSVELDDSFGLPATRGPQRL